MTGWRLRDLTDDDLEEAVSLDAASSTVEQRPLFPLSEVVASLVAGQPAVAAESGGRLVGTAVGRVDGDRGWVLRIALHPQWRNQGLGSQLLALLEQRLVAAGARRLTCALPAGETGTHALRNSGFAEREDIVWFEKLEQLRAGDVETAASLGGAVPPPNLWGQVQGMSFEKQLIERRIVLPLSHVSLAGGARLARPTRGDAVRSTRDRQDDVRPGDRESAGMAIRGAVPLSSGWVGQRSRRWALRGLRSGCPDGARPGVHR